MKKFIAILLVLCCIPGLLISCGNKPQTAPEDTKETTKETTKNEEIKTYEIPVNQSLEYDYDLYEYINLPEYKKFELDYTILTIDEKDVDDRIFGLRLEKAQKTEITDRGIKEGDIAEVSYSAVSSQTGKSVGSSENTTISVGSGRFIPGFEQALIGLKTGSQKTFETVLPEDFTSNKQLAGSNVKFTVKVLKIYVADLPEADDAFARSLEYDGVKNMEELTAYVKNDMTQAAQYQTGLYKQTAFFNKLSEETKVIAWPEKEYNYYYNLFEKNMNAKAQACQTDLQSVIIGDYKTMEAYEEARTKDAKDKTLKDMIIFQLQRLYNIEMTKEEFNEALQYYYNDKAESYNITDMDDFYEKFGESIANGLRSQLVMEAAVKDVPDKQQ